MRGDRGRRRAALVGLLGLAPALATVAWTPATAAVQVERAATVGSTSPPAVDDVPRYGTPVSASPGTWSPEPESTTYQWRVDGAPVDGATASSFTPRRADIGHALSVSVTATAPGHSPGTASSEPVTVRRALFGDRALPSVLGVPRFGRALRFESFPTTPAATRFSFQWLRSGRAITGETGPRHRVAVADVGRLVSVRVTAHRPGYVPVTETSRPQRVLHRTAVRHTVTYEVETRGRITADVATFRRLAQATYDDPRGWRGGGVAFRRVDRGGDLTLVLAEASWLPRFSSQCSAQWSCRVGRYVVINQMRWQEASAMWHRTGGTLRDYRHMVVNHETGHWLGHGHRGCPSPGALAPVMQTQSKGLDGCRPNPFPVATEWQSAWRR